MGEEVREFALHWNNFTDNIVNSFQLLHKHQELCDVTLAVEGKLLKAHKIVLSICSPYFQEMFNSSAANQPLFFVLHNMSAKLVMNLLEFMYMGTVNVQQCELQAFMKIAESLKIKGLTSSSKTPTIKKSQDEAETEKSLSEKKIAQKRHLEVEERENENDDNSTSESDYRNNIIEITDLSNDDDEDQDNEIIDNNLHNFPITIPEVTMHDSNPKTTSDDHKSGHNNLKISSAQTLNHFTSDFNESKKQAFFTENPPDSSGSNVTMLSSTSLLHGNCIFNRNNTVATQAGLKTYWLCKSYRMTMCKARCITHQGKVISATGIHNHLPHVSNKPTEIPPGHTPNLVYNSSNQQAPPIPEVNQVFINPSVSMQQQQSSQQSSIQTSYNFMPHYMTQALASQPGMSLNNSSNAADISFNIAEFNNHTNNVKMEQI